ncbi:hypothetical protein J1N35_009675 [Gossypium stocksii]|uniref:Uncharacterized protein n=1 Tax=Gossypium stocksii TaxID=47602 RepID=A0A9D3VZI8_9ROSI|nr:hypothetical protein J1N35_009675 [Gossypium stocksii]
MDSRLNALAFIAQPEESVTKIDRPCEAISAAQKAPCVARDVASGLYRDGVWLQYLSRQPLIAVT